MGSRKSILTMALTPQELEIILNGGQNTKAGSELADASQSLREVTNLRFNQIGQLEKRPTYASEATPEIPTGSDYDRVKLTSLFTREDKVCALTDNHGVCYLTQDDDTAISYPTRLVGSTDAVGFAPVACQVQRSILERTQFGSNQNGIYQVASALYDDTLVIAWIELNGVTDPYLKYKAVDVKTGKIITPTKTTLMSGAVIYSLQMCRSGIASNEGAIISYSYGTGPAPYTIRTIRWDAATKTFIADSNLTANSKYVNHTLNQGLNVNDPGILFSFTDNTSNVIKAHYGTIATISGGSSTVHTGTTTGVIPGAFISGSGVGAASLVVTYDSTHVYAERWGTPASVQTLLTSAASATPVTEGVIGCTAAVEYAANDNRAVVWANFYASESWGQTYRVRSCQVDFSSTTLSLGYSDVLPNAWLATTGFWYGERAHVGVICGTLADGASASVLLLRHASRAASSNYTRHDPVARILHDRYFSPGIGVFGGHAQVTLGRDGADAVDGNLYAVLPGDPSEAEAATYGLHLPQTIFLSTLKMPLHYESDSNPCFPVPFVENDRVTTLASGILFDFDGDTVAESTPIDRPTVLVDATGAGSTTTAGVMSVRAIYRWVDNQGRLHRSAPSEADSVAIITNKNIVVYVSKPITTALDGLVPLQSLEPELYITEEGGSTYYLALNSTGEKHTYDSEYTWNTWWVFDDVQPGTVGVQLYSTGANGSEVVPEPTPAFSDITRVGDRLWALDAEDPSRVWFTKPFSAGYAPEWSGSQTLFIGDNCISIRDLGGIPTIFGSSGIHQVYGSGPDALGNGFFEPARRLPYEIGCIDRLTCKTTTGIVFRGRKGFYLLGNGGDLKEIGLPIDPVSRAPAVADYSYARILEDDVSNEIRIIDDHTGKYFIYNVLEDKWTEFSQNSEEQYTVDAVFADGRFYYLHWDETTATPTLRREYGVDEASYNVSTEGYSLGTHWVKPDGLAGQGRLWRLFLHMMLPSDCSDIENITLSYYTDYSDSVAQSWTWTGSELNTIYSAEEPTAKLSVIPAKQVITSFRVRVAVTFTSASAGPRPLNLRVSYGVRQSKSKRAKPSVK